uniref:Ubiquitin-like modifier-activating enzyme ATG7 n=1 Tax=Romanomermis culicivorax TaxID=13658 RepID=A0A915JNA2_ROMCU
MKDNKRKSIHTYDFCGELILFNKLNDFKGFDKKTILDEYGRRIMASIVSGTALTNPSTLNTFFVLAFAVIKDLKKYHYYYWFAFPAIGLLSGLKCHKIDKVTDLYDNKDMKDLTSCIVDRKFSSFAFIVEIGFENGRKTFNCRPFESFKSFRTNEKIHLGFCDPSHDSKTPGWPLRNLLAAWSYYTCAASISVLCWRQCSKNGVASFEDSIILTLAYGKFESSDFKTYGWERNEHGLLAPRFLNLSRSMDPRRLADEALTLNLRLMRWRLIPELNLDTIFQISCLIFGVGTLGCNVARCLLGWGVRTITLIDDGSVSFSNPVRQTLYNFEDCISSTGKSKAHVAVEALKKIFPNVSVFYQLPGLDPAERYGARPGPDCFDKLNDTAIPPCEAFYSTLRKEAISEEDYEMCKKYWVTNQMQILKDFLVFYNLCDVVPFLEEQLNLGFCFKWVMLDTNR